MVDGGAELVDFTLMQMLQVLVDEGVHDSVAVVLKLGHQLRKLDTFNCRMLLQPLFQVSDPTAGLDHKLLLFDQYGAKLRAE